MALLQLRSAAEQVAAHLRAEIVTRSRGGEMPGANRLAEELGVNHKTAETALQLLENEGLLINQGARRGRLIDFSGDGLPPPGLRVALLLMHSPDRGVDFVIELRHLLEEAGQIPFYPRKALLDLGMEAKRVASFVKQTEADAWVVCAGSREILAWFSQQPAPSFALFGQREGLPIAAAGPDKASHIAALTQQLIELGHRRIVLLCRRQLRLPEPVGPLRAFLDALEAGGIQAGEYNLPDWEETKEGFQILLESLFRLTPPTALILDEPYLFNAAIYFAATRGLRTPEDVSLICTDGDPSFAWCEPSVAHIRWDYRPVVRRVVRWAANVSRGVKDVRQTISKAEFVEGGTVGPAPTA